MTESGSKSASARAARSGETARELLRRSRQITRRKFPAKEKIRILLEGTRAELSVAELCRRQGVHPTVFYSYWLKDSMEAGKARMRGHTCGTPRRPRCTSSRRRMSG
jgi:transposase-like protein